MPKRISGPQYEWYLYKQMRDIMDRFGFVFQDPNDGWGPFVSPEQPDNPWKRDAEFFNILWDFGGGLREQEELIITDELLKEVTDKMEHFSRSERDYDPKQFKVNFNHLKKQAEKMGFFV